MTSHSPRLPRGPRKPSPGPHRRRRPVPKYDTIDWDSPCRPVFLGVDTDYTCSRAYHCTPIQVERRRREYFIPPPPPRGEQGNWPSDNELRRQNILAGQRRKEEVRRRSEMTSSGAWMDGRLGWDEGDDDED